MVFLSRFSIHHQAILSKLNQQFQIHKIGHVRLVSSSPIPNNKTKNISSTSYPIADEEEQFRVLELVRKKFERKPKKSMPEEFFKQPREKRQPIDQDWGSVWPNARSFHPASVPLPVGMGVPRKGQPSPDKWANAELMKIPNFLHLTPPVIERQCEAIKKFCTKWPENLQSEKQLDYFFPVTMKKSTYLHSSPTIRDPRSRIITLKVNVESLKLDAHGLDKMLRLVGERFDPKTNILTLTADRCPLSIQNAEYCLYLLTVLYLESVKTESWEHEKQIHDVQHYSWRGSPSEHSLKQLENSIGNQFNEEDTEKFSEAVTTIHNNGENEESIQEYRKAVLRLLNL